MPRNTAEPKVLRGDSSMVGKKQLDANRRNALASTGPRTPAGKRESSKNATKHGVYAGPHAIPRGAFAEDAGDVASFLEQIVEALAPDDDIEFGQARLVATTYLQLERLSRLEAEAISAESRVDNHDELIAQLAGLTGEDRVDTEIAARNVLTKCFEKTVLLRTRLGRELERALTTSFKLKARDEVPGE